MAVTIDLERKRIAVRAVTKAGSYIKRMYGQRVNAELKPSGSFVSEVDRNSEEIFIRAIRESFPDDGILAEESPEILSKNGYRWGIDALDGTDNFFSLLWDFGCGLSLEFGGEVIYGLCFFPMYMELFSAETGRGAFCNQKGICVSDANTLLSGVFLPDSNFRVKTERCLEDVRRMVNVGCRLRIIGCSHRGLCLVASGRALVAISRSGRPWDISPASIIIQEAGGKTTDENNKPWKIGSEELIATNGLVHDEVLNLLRGG